MRINIFTEIELTSIRTTGIVTSYKGLKKGLIQEGVEVVVNAKNDYDILHVHSFGPLSLGKILREKKPVVITTHTVPDEISLLYRGGFMVESLFEKYLAFFYNQADLLICPSEFAKNRIKRMDVSSRIVVESNGIDVNKFFRSEEKRQRFRKLYNIKESEVVIGSVGIPSKRKGLDVVVKMAEQFADVKFFWIGENVYGRLLKDYTYLKQLYSQHPKNLVITGYVKDIQAAYSGMDIFLFPTMIETEGLVILEATCSELPIIASTVEGLSWIEDKKQCLKAKSIEEYIKAISTIIQHPQKGKELVKSAKELTVEKDMNTIIKKMINHYENIL
ncbi:MAG: glycosyltransferase family 4 protein [Thermoplasmatota archaeon]